MHAHARRTPAPRSPPHTHRLALGCLRLCSAASSPLRNIRTALAEKPDHFEHCMSPNPWLIHRHPRAPFSYLRPGWAPLARTFGEKRCFFFGTNAPHAPGGTRTHALRVGLVMSLTITPYATRPSVMMIKLKRCIYSRVSDRDAPRHSPHLSVHYFKSVHP